MGGGTKKNRQCFPLSSSANPLQKEAFLPPPLPSPFPSNSRLACPRYAKVMVLSHLAALPILRKKIGNSRDGKILPFPQFYFLLLSPYSVFTTTTNTNITAGHTGHSREPQQAAHSDRDLCVVPEPLWPLQNPSHHLEGNDGHPGAALMIVVLKIHSPNVLASARRGGEMQRCQQWAIKQRLILIYIYPKKLTNKGSVQW